MILDKAKSILKEEFLKNYDIADDFGKYYMDEKIRHSYQVLGAGNYILAHEDIFINESENVKDRLQATLLLHDIGRFYEARVGHHGVKVDHGLYGADILMNKTEFNDIKIFLPIRHHGHLIEELYEDNLYLNLDLAEKQEILKIIYLVMDADKIANFYLLAREFKNMEVLFFSGGVCERTEKKPSPLVFDAFMQHKLINRKYVQNLIDRTLMLWGCAYDLHYASSFKFLKRLNIMDRFYAEIRKYFTEEDARLFYNEMHKFLKEFG